MAKSKKVDPRNDIVYPDTEITYMVWNRYRSLQKLELQTTNIDLALAQLESLVGKKKYAYIYYVVGRTFTYLCGSLDNKWSRKDWRMAVKLLLSKKRSKAFGLMSPGRPIS